MNITIMHLYYDLMNLYGENGNVKAIKSYLENIGVKVTIKFVSISDKIDLNDVDILYIGQGTEENEIKALKHILKYKKELKDYIEKDNMVLATGNAYELFGKSIKNNNKINALGIFNYETEIQNNRIVDECICKTNLIKEKILGFTNRNSIVNNIDKPLFEVTRGKGSDRDNKIDGYLYKNFYGTNLIGPILARNPMFLDYLMKNILKKKEYKVDFNKLDLSVEKQAYKNYIQKYNIE